MTTTLQVVPQVRIGSQDRAQGLVIHQDKTANLSRTIPVRTKLKKTLDLYCKKTRSSLMILMVVSMSPFYSIDAYVSSGRTGTAPFLRRA
jgi:hypothetical protein